MDILDLKGPEFLSLYVPLLVGGFLAALLLRYLLRLPAGQPLESGGRMEPYEVAALGGPDALIEATVASLFHRNVLRIEGPRIATGAALPSSAVPIERSVFECAATGSTTLEDLRRALRPDLQHFRQRLARQGLLMDGARATQTQLLPSLAYGAILLLGVTKICVGLSRDKPVVFLVLLVGLGALGLLVLGRRPWRSRLGDATLGRLREEHQALRTTATAGDSSKLLGAPELALAVGLFGPAMLIPMGYGGLRHMLRPPSSSGGGDDPTTDTDFSSDDDEGDSSSASSCSSSDGGGGGGDGGGGGGCGGCGGGGGD